MEWNDWVTFGISILTFLMVTFLPKVREHGFKLSTNASREKEKETEAELEKRKEAEKLQYRSDMFNLFNLCKLKNCKTTDEIAIFYETYTKYKSLGGNSWAESLKMQFESIPNEGQKIKKNNKKPFN